MDTIDSVFFKQAHGNMAHGSTANTGPDTKAQGTSEQGASAITAGTLSGTARPVGVFLTDTRIRFVVWAPNASQVELEVRHAGATQRLPMQADTQGYWQTETERPETVADVRYGYWLDGSGPFPDPASRYQPEGVDQLSAIASPDFPWQDAQWSGLELKQMILYELHTGTFTEQGTFEGIISKLDYLGELGINAIELMPVAQFSGNRGWGYDGVFPFAVQHSYGGPEGLKRLVNACHQRGIAVIMDVVYNHLGPEGNYLPRFGPYLHTRYQQGWGDAVNFDNRQSDAVRRFFIQNALMWLEEYHIDGLRLDAVHSIWDFGAKHFLAELSQAVQAFSRQSGKTRVLIAESDLNDVKLLLPPSVNGFGLHSQWLDDFHHALHALVTGEVHHYYRDFGTLDHLQKAFEQSYVYNGIYSPFREKTFGNTAESAGYDQFVVYAQNHDQIGNRLRNDRLTSLLPLPMLQVVAGTYLLSPYVPMLFMGEEYGETNPFYYFIDYSGAQLVEAVRKGRREEFAGFQQEGVAYEDPQSEHTFEHSRLSWDVQPDHRQQLLDFYKQLIAIRRQHPAFQNTKRGSVQSWIEHGQVLAWMQPPTQPQQSWLLCAASFGEEAVSFSLPENRQWVCRIDSAATGSPTTDTVREKVVLNGVHFMAWASVPVED